MSGRVTIFPYYGEAYDDFITFVTQYYSDNPALPKEILLPIPPDEQRGMRSQKPSHIALLAEESAAADAIEAASAA